MNAKSEDDLCATSWFLLQLHKISSRNCVALCVKKDQIYIYMYVHTMRIQVNYGAM